MEYTKELRDLIRLATLIDVESEIIKLRTEVIKNQYTYNTESFLISYLNRLQEKVDEMKPVSTVDFEKQAMENIDINMTHEQVT